MKPTVFHAPVMARPRDALRRALGVKGRSVGSGAYATVYNSPKSSRHVVKVGDLDDPYLDYVKFILRSRSRSSLFPKIVDVVYCIESGYDPEMALEDREGAYAVVMERLHSSSTARNENLRELICGLIDNSGHGSYDLEIRDALKTVASLKLGPKDIKGIFKMVDWISDLADETGNDLDFHDGNIMFRRNGDLVITDPFC